MRLRFSALILLFATTMTPTRASAPGRQAESAQPQAGMQQAEPVDPRIQKEMEKKRAKQQYKDIQRDTTRLLELATDLKQQVDRAGENVMSLDVIKKCDEIEKLSKTIRGKMKGS